MRSRDSLSLTATQQEQYHQQGFVHLPMVLRQEELDQYRREAEALRETVGPPKAMKTRIQIESEPDNGQMKLRQIEPVTDLSSAFERLSRDPRTIGPVEQLFGEPAVLFEDKLNYKPARVGSGFPMHQDRSYWQKYSKRLLTVFVHIDDATPDNGCMRLVPGEQRDRLLSCSAWEDGTHHKISVDELDSSQAIEMPCHAGDVLIFHCMTPHESSPNRSDQERRAIIFSYNPLSDGNVYRERYADVLI